MDFYAGLDIGGTNGRLKISDINGQALGEFEAAGCSINTDGFEKSRLRCRNLVLPALDTLGLKAESCQGICAAISGVDSDSIADFCRKAFEEMGFPGRHLQIMNDCEVFLHLSKGPSLVIISGTGSICYGRNMEGQLFRTGGWNHIISDEGSGFDLGLKFLQAAANDLDGRTKAPLLTSMVIRETGLDTLEKINQFINDHLLEKSVIARISETGYEAARQGDQAACHILDQCSDMLYHLIDDTVKKLDPSGSIEADLWLWGSVLVKNHILNHQLSQKVAAGLPALRVMIPELSALDTALLVART